MSRIVDMNCHILPRIDDGAQNISCSRKMLEISKEKGITNFVFTPHYYPERIHVSEFQENRNQAVEQIKDVVKELGIHFRVGAEVQFTPILDIMPLKDIAISGTKYLLLEMLPFYEPYDAEGLIRRICAAGYIPILAHIECFSYIEQNPLLLYQWVKAGALAQINAGYLLKDRRAKKRVIQYYHWNLVHLMASDMHSLIERPQNLMDAYSRLPSEVAEEFQANAETIFKGDIVESRSPIKPKRFWGHWK